MARRASALSLVSAACWITVLVAIAQASPQPEPVIQRGHSRRVVQLAMAEGGRLLVSRGQDQSIRLWDLASRLLVRVWPSNAFDCAISSDGRWLVTAVGKPDADAVFVSDVTTGGPAASLVGGAPADANGLRVQALACVPEHDVVAVALSYTTGLSELRPVSHVEVRFFDLPRRHEVFRLAYTPDEAKAFDLMFPVTKLAVAPDGQRLYVGFRGGIDVWDLAHRVLRGRWPAAQGDGGRFVAAIAASPDGQRLATTSHPEYQRDPDPLGTYSDTPAAGEQLAIRDAVTGNVIQSIPLTSHRIHALAFSRDGRRLIGGGVGGLSTWDAGSGALLRSVNDAAGWGAPVLALSPRDDVVATAGSKVGSIGISNLESDQSLDTLAASPDTLTQDLMTVMPDGQRLYVAHNGHLFEWDLGAELEPAIGGFDRLHNNILQRLDASDFGAVCALGHDGGTPLVLHTGGVAARQVRLWDGHGDRTILTLDNADTLNGADCRISQDGRVVVVGHRDAASRLTYEVYQGRPPVRAGSCGPFESLSALLGVYSSPQPRLVVAHGPMLNNLIDLCDPSSPRPRWRVASGNYYVLDLHGGGIVGTWDDGQGRLSLWGTTPPSDAPPSRIVAALQGRHTTLMYLDGADSTLHATLDNGGELTLDARTLQADNGRADSLPLGHAVQQVGDDDAAMLMYGSRSADGRIVAFPGRDGAIHVLDLRVPGGGGVFRLLFASPATDADPSADYVLLAPDGFYAANVGATGLVGFRAGDAAYPFEQFDLQLDRPDVVFKRLGFAKPQRLATYRAAFNARLARLGKTEAEAAASSDWGHLPEVTLSARDVPLVTDSTEVTLTVKCHAVAKPVERLLVWMNDVPVAGPRGMAVDCPAGARVEIPVKLRLTSGPNVVELSAVDGSRAESLRRRVLLTCRARPTSNVLYVATVGVGDYHDDALRLDFAAKDARDVADFFLHKGRFAPWGKLVNLPKPDMKYGYGDVRTLSLLDGQVNRDAIAALKQFLAPAGPDDTAIVFLAGHGTFVQDGQYYFATGTTDLNHPQGQGISFNDLQQLVNGSGARQRLLLIDSCYAGLRPIQAATGASDSVPDGGGTEGRSRGVKGTVALPTEPRLVLPTGAEPRLALPFYDDVFRDLRRTTGAVVIASSRGDESSFERKRYQNGLFTFVLIKGLSSGEADADHDGRVTVAELQRYVNDNVSKLSNGQQHPSTVHDQLNRDFAVVRFPQFTLTPEGLKPPQ